MINWIKYFFFMNALHASTNMENEFKFIINMFRSNPLRFVKTFNLSASCNIQIDQHLLMLYNDRDLDQAALFQAKTLSFNNCSQINHLTCNLYCKNFGSCDPFVRINSFLSKNHDNICEILIKGAQNAMSIFIDFLSSQEHCEIMMNKYVSSIGVSFQKHDKNMFVGVFANIYDIKKTDFINTFYNDANNQTYFFVNSVNSTNVNLIINQMSYNMTSFFNKFFFHVRLDKTFPKNTSYYFTDVNNNNSTIYKI